MDDHRLSYHIRLAEYSGLLCSGDLFPLRHSYALAEQKLPKRSQIPRDEAIGCICYYDWKESNISIGEDGAELGYWLAKPYWNQGLGTEAVRGLVFVCSCTRFCRVDSQNALGGRFDVNAARK